LVVIDRLVLEDFVFTSGGEEIVSRAVFNQTRHRALPVASAAHAPETEGNGKVIPQWFARIQ
jgi:hypothetical protein